MNGQIPPTEMLRRGQRQLQAKLVLLALILVAAVAEPESRGGQRRLAVDWTCVQRVADEPELDRGRLLAGSRGLGAVLRCSRRSIWPQDDADPRDSARHPIQRARRIRPQRKRPVFARVGGGLSAGMAYPTTLALITALWSGPARTRSIALWSGIGAAIAALGPMLAGLSLEHFWWGSVFLITLPLAVVALVMAPRLVPAHVNEGTEPVDNLGGILSVFLVGGVILAINFSVVPDEGTLVAVLGVIAVAAGIAFVVRQQRASNPCMTCRWPAAARSGSPAAPASSSLAR